MRIIELIEKKRDGRELTPEEIRFIVQGYTRDEIPDYQVAAFLMAVVWRGLSRAELATLTESMLHSGQVLDLSHLPGAKVDKHSTGGVGDKTSLILAPVAAAGGLTVPMISGRGLGHTGGTLDKLESIPGFSVDLSLRRFTQVLSECGCGMIGQTEEIAPADKKLYALRGFTGTVPSPFLICASIMSKKLAEGIDALVLDVKTGSGAFMKREEDAICLAELMVETGRRMGKKTVALITDMNQPLGRAVGNSLEVIECLEVLQDGGPADLRGLTLELCGWMFCLGGRAASVEEGRRLGMRLLKEGAGLEKFRQMIRCQGGDARAIDQWERLPRAAHQMDLPSRSSGFVSSIACDQIGNACVVLGGGRERKDDRIDPAVGIRLHKKLGDAVTEGEALCTIHFNSERRLEEACRLMLDACHIGVAAPSQPLPMIRKVIGAGFQQDPHSPAADGARAAD